MPASPALPAPRLALLAALVACAPGPDDDATTTTTTTTVAAESDPSSGPSAPLLCVPDEIRCAADGHTRLICGPLGHQQREEPCGADERCIVDACLGPCDLIAATPTSTGCSFWAHPEMGALNEGPGGIIVANPGDAPATVQLLRIPRGKRHEEPAEPPVILAPGDTHVFSIMVDDVGDTSVYFVGDTLRVASDRPIVAYQHSPLASESNNDASLLLPTPTLGTDYIVASYPSYVGPSFFRVIATENDTTVTWTPPVNTGGNGLPIPFVAAGETGSLTMNRGDTIRIGASAIDQPELQDRDLSGALIAADKPIWVLGGNPCANIPFGTLACDHLEEVLLPLATWGRRYVGARAPVRGAERSLWRIFAGDPGVTVTSDPPIAGLPHTFGGRGEWIELSVDHDVSLVLDGDGPFMPVQYVVGNGADAGYGDPSIVQMVPVDQYLRAYTFATALGYPKNVVQVIRRAGAAAVRVDDILVDGYVAVGEFEVADVEIADGGHHAESEDPFGIVGYGYSSYASYAYPGGMQMRPIFSP